MGPAYLRYSFTKGTVKEIDALLDRLDLSPPTRVLDVGCGPGRHANELGRRGLEVHGVDISETFLDVARSEAPAGVTYERLDARRMPFQAEFDLVISICQGAFGMSGGPAAGEALDPDLEILAGMARALKPGGTAVFTAFNAYLQVANMVDGHDFDADRGVHRETTEIRDPDGVDRLTTDLWTTCFTPQGAPADVRSGRARRSDRSTSVEPGDWTARPPDHRLTRSFSSIAAGSLSGAVFLTGRRGPDGRTVSSIRRENIVRHNRPPSPSPSSGPSIRTATTSPARSSTPTSEASTSTRPTPARW